MIKKEVKTEVKTEKKKENEEDSLEKSLKMLTIYSTEQFKQLNDKMDSILSKLSESTNKDKQLESSVEVIQKLIHSNDLNKVVSDVRQEFPLPSEKPLPISSKPVIIEKHDEFSLKVYGDTYGCKHLIKEASGKWVSDSKSWNIPVDKLNLLIESFTANGIPFHHQSIESVLIKNVVENTGSVGNVLQEVEININNITIDMFRD